MCLRAPLLALLVLAAALVAGRKDATSAGHAVSSAWQLQREGGRSGGGRALRAAAAAVPPLPTGKPFNMGTYTVTDVWINPTAGSDVASGATHGTAKRTLTAAWGAIPRATSLTRGYRLRLTAGNFTEAMRERRWGWGLERQGRQLMCSSQGLKHTPSSSGAPTASLLASCNTPPPMRRAKLLGEPVGHRRSARHHRGSRRGGQRDSGWSEHG